MQRKQIKGSETSLFALKVAECKKQETNPKAFNGPLIPRNLWFNLFNSSSFHVASLEWC